MVEETRFDFGRNWNEFLASCTEENFVEAERSLREALGVDALEARSFLDIGSGSGIHSLAAHRLGAGRIVSFDYDRESVACTAELHRRAGSPSQWTVCQGSALDPTFLEDLGRFDVVYSWGVLHHTGRMWEAIENAAGRVDVGGRLLIGIYNEKRPLTDVMKVVKRVYSSSGPMVRAMLRGPFWLATAAVTTLRGGSVREQIAERASIRGMNYWRDLEDWLGGWPYECATPDAVNAYVAKLGFREIRSTRRSSFAAVNEFLYQRT